MNISKLLLVAMIYTPSMQADFKGNVCHEVMRDPSRVFDGFSDMIDGAGELLRSKDTDVVVAGVRHLSEGISRLVEVAVKESGLDEEELLKLRMISNGFGDQVKLLISDGSILKSLDEKDEEHQKMVEGLTIILYNMLSILINPNKVGSYLANILGGVYKVISSILADGKVGRADFDRLLSALESIITFGKSNIK